MSVSSRPEPAGRPLRLAFATSSLRRGGGGIAELSRQALATLREMAGQGAIELRLHVLEDAGPEEGDALFAAGPESSRWYGGRRWRFVTALLRDPVDVVLFDHVGLARVHGLLARASRRPYYLMIHSIEIWRSERVDYARSAHRADLLIANSDYTAQRARARYPGLPEIAVCWPGKDVEPEGAPAGDSAFGAARPMTMLIVGRLDGAQRHKGHDELLEAMPLLLGRVPEARLLVAGQGSDRERLERKAAGLGVAGAVEFLGRVEDDELQRLYRACSLFVMPSDGDGFGLVFLEAMANGLACVGLAGSAAEEILDGGACGLLVDRSDPAALASALAGLLLDGERRAALAAAGQARYRDVFTRAHYGHRLATLLAGHMGRRR